MAEILTNQASIAGILSIQVTTNISHIQKLITGKLGISLQFCPDSNLM